MEITVLFMPYPSMGIYNNHRGHVDMKNVAETNCEKTMVNMCLTEMLNSNKNIPSYNKSNSVGCHKECQERMLLKV